jgi:TonB family protein
MKAAAIQIRNAMQPYYPTSELKKSINWNTLRGFIFTDITIILLIFFYIILELSSKSTEIPLNPPLKTGLIEIITLDGRPNIDVPFSEPSEKIIGTKFIEGNYIPVPPTLLSVDINDIATTNNGGTNLSHKGTEPDLPDFNPKMNSVPQIEKESGTNDLENEPGKFVVVDKEPEVDLERLQKNIIYPPIPIKIGIEGKVITRVLVDKFGKAKKVIVDYTDSDLLNDAATKAITDYGVFTPARRNGEPVPCWVSIPIVFRLK